MTRTRLSASLAIATALTGSALSLGAPMAHADPRDGVRAAVNAARSGTTCPALNYRADLEAAAFDVTQNVYGNYQTPASYVGSSHGFRAVGDPAKVAIQNLTTSGAFPSAIRDCSYKDYGVGFFRDDMNNHDAVAVVLGAPAPPAAAPAPPQQPDPRPIRCTGTGVIVPAGQTCPAKPPPPATPTATVNPATDLYNRPNDDGKASVIGMLHAGQVVKLDTTKNSTCSPDAWCILIDPAGAAWGRDLTNN